MSAFDRLDPLVQHHIVNTLGWRELRPLQEASIEPVLSGKHCLLLAPTAGGKTEAAMFPLLSRMCGEQWAALSILYICPLKALINNLGERLEKYTRMLGRRASVWHGDISQSNRQQTRVEPPDVLLTTPESLEAMLISVNATMKAHLRNLQAVVVDEIHAFAGDDRGWHLLCVLERLVGVCGRDFQRVGLSATVGNPEFLLEWLVGNSAKERVVVQPPVENAAPAEVMLDYVGSLENAAVVISRLHRGEKRLVFCDSRSRVESLAGLLRSCGVRTFVSHSSLSAAERRRSEEAFARGEDCVIVATSTLELGIDVGDLDRVIQIDAPAKVASFLQRLGRTGRRSGKPRNCLFLATNDDALLQAAAILDLWQKNYVEPILPPPNPYHILAQQALALCLQHGGLGQKDLLLQLERLPAARNIEREDLSSILAHLIGEEWLATDGIRYFVGEAGETEYGRRNFLELVSVFTSPPVLSVTDGRQELGFVDQNLFLSGDRAEGRLISLAGRGWRVMNVDWNQRRVYVAPAEMPGKTVWFGTPRGLSTTLCRAICGILLDHQRSSGWSQRASDRIQQVRLQFVFLRPDATAVVRHPDNTTSWFTFGGAAVNQVISQVLAKRGIPSERVGEFLVVFAAGFDRERFEHVLMILSPTSVLDAFEPSRDIEDALKFSECVPAHLRQQEFQQRQCSIEAIQGIFRKKRFWFVL